MASRRSVALLVCTIAILLAIGLYDLVFPCSRGGHRYVRHVVTDDPLAKCLDGSPPVYYYRRGSSPGKLIIALKGGGWCTSEEDCYDRSLTALGSSTSYPQCTASVFEANGWRQWLWDYQGLALDTADTAYEGGLGLLSSLPESTAWAGYSIAFFMYCDGGSMTGTRRDPVEYRPASGGNESATHTLYYRGHHNFEASLNHVLRTHYAQTPLQEAMLAGCSAGGMAAVLKCDWLAERLAPVPLKCMSDAALFWREDFSYIAEAMEPELPASCPAAAKCLHAEVALPWARTPNFVICTLYNFMPAFSPAFDPAFNAFVPPNFTPQLYAQYWAQGIWAAVAAFTFAPVPWTPAKQRGVRHGAFINACPMHCQTSMAWNTIRIDGVEMAESARRWYFENATEQRIDPADGSINPTCPPPEASRYPPAHEPPLRAKPLTLLAAALLAALAAAAVPLCHLRGRCARRGPRPARLKPSAEEAVALAPSHELDEVEELEAAASAYASAAPVPAAALAAALET